MRRYWLAAPAVGPRVTWVGDAILGGERVRGTWVGDVIGLSPGDSPHQEPLPTSESNKPRSGNASRRLCGKATGLAFPKEYPHELYPAQLRTTL